MNRILRFALFVISVLLFSNVSHAQFGKNKVQYRDFEWKYIQSRNFDVYYYDSTYHLAVFTAVKAEAALKQIEDALNYTHTQRFSIIVYNSHDEFQQTNVIESYLPEGVGGVTEIYKNRVVLPFMGNYSQFRHVIHHELVHAVLNDMFYGGTIQTAVSTNNVIDFPLWMNEGLAEYLSQGGLDTHTDMFMRDMALSENLIDLNSLNGYYAYRGGQAFYWYVAEKYGEPKVGDFINRFRVGRTAENAFKSTFNMSLEDFSDQWKKDMKKYYLPDIDKYKDPGDDYAFAVTNHKKISGYYNSSPAISPNGDKMAFISDRDGTFGIYITDLEKKGKNKDEAERLINSFRQRDFEELNILTPGISWNPKGDKLAISAKAGGEDAIFLVNVKNGDYEKHTFGLSSVSSVSWSPDGKTLAFIGSDQGKSDIYTYTIATKKLGKITNDVWSDFEPVWSWDSKKLYFISDRGDSTDEKHPSLLNSIWDASMTASDVYVYDFEKNSIKRLTFDPQFEKTSIAVSPDGKNLFYISDKNGIGNIYDLNLETGKVKAKTNSLTGIMQLSLSPSGNELLFCSQKDGKYDIFLIREPFTKLYDVDSLPDTKFRKSVFEKQKLIANINAAPDSNHNNSTKLIGYGNFDLEFSRSQVVRPNPDALEKQKNEESGLSSGQINDSTFAEKEYKVKFSPDIVYGNPGYNTFYGYQGVAQIMFSDVLGNHQIYTQFSFLDDLRNSNILVSYTYLPKIIDYNITAYHSSLLYSELNRFGNYDLARIRDYGLSASALYPFDLFNRFEFGARWMNLSKENLTNDSAGNIFRMLFIPSVRYVHDDVLYGFTAPLKGLRYFVSLMGTPAFTTSSIGFYNILGDLRYYVPLSEYISIAVRGSAGASFGPNPRSFFLGGTDNWINRQFNAYTGLTFSDPVDFAFMNFVTPLRGWTIAQVKGSRYFATNYELRFPVLLGLIGGRSWGFIQGMMGCFFFDLGGAWDGSFSNFKAAALNPNKISELQAALNGGVITQDQYNQYYSQLRQEPFNLLMSTGVGLRGYLLGLPLKLDVAWSNLMYAWSTPWYLVSLGYDF